MDREAESDGERRTAAPEFADGESSCGAGRTGLRNGTHAAVRIDRPVRRSRAHRVHHASARLLWSANAGRVGNLDVQASRPSFTPVWSLAPATSPLSEERNFHFGTWRYVRNLVM